MLDYIGPIAIVLLLGLWAVNAINNYFDDLDRREDELFYAEYYEILDAWYTEQSSFPYDTRRLPDDIGQ